MRTITKIRFAEILLKIVYLINPAIKKRNGRAVVRRKNINWALDIREGIDLSIYVFGGFERDSINIYNKISRCDGLVVFDVGANIGSHTLLLASLVSEDSMIHSFEPTEFAYNKLSYNIGLNSDLSGKIICKQYFLSSTEQSKPPESVYSSWVLLSDGVNKHMHHRGVMKETSGALQTTIDEYCLVNKIQRIDFMKLDVDGYELDVLEGARETVRSSHPVVLFEYAPYVQEEHGYC